MTLTEAMGVIKFASPAFYYAMTEHRTHRNKPLDLIRDPFLIKLYQDNNPDITVMKSTQSGISEWVICLTIVGAINGRNIFYVLPTYNLIGRFVRERVDKTIQMTPAYQQHGIQEGRTLASNIGMKQIGLGTVVFAASNTPTAFTEFAADWFIVDELDRCNQANLEMGWERLSNAETQHRRIIKVSNPTMTGYGIDAAYSETNQMRWHIKHDCGAWVQPDFFKHVIREEGPGQFVYCDEDFDPDTGIDAKMICDKCGRPVNRRGEGQWVAGYPGRRKHGYQISKLFSANVTLQDIVERFEKGQNDPESMVRFYNGDLGHPYDASGAKVTVADLEACEQEYPLGYKPEGGVFIAGVDVGAVYNVCIGHMAYGVPGVKLIDAKEVRDTEDLKDLFKKYGVSFFVIDALPETRESLKISTWAVGGFVCYYSGAKRETFKGKTVSVDRTMALDAIKEIVALGGLSLPAGARNIPNFYDQMTSSVRMYDSEANGGEGAYRWVEGSKADHYFHACGYMLTAGRIVIAAKR